MKIKMKNNNKNVCVIIEKIKQTFHMYTYIFTCTRTHLRHVIGLAPSNEYKVLHAHVTSVVTTIEVDEQMILFVIRL